jgi:hypothetical protein
MIKRLGRYETRRFRKEVRTRFPRKPGNQSPDQGKTRRANQGSFEMEARAIIGARVADLLAFKTTLQETDAAETFHDAGIAVSLQAVLEGDRQSRAELLRDVVARWRDLMGCGLANRLASISQPAHSR